MPIHWTPVKILYIVDLKVVMLVDFERQICIEFLTWPEPEEFLKLQVVNPAPQGSTAGLYSLVPHTQRAPIYTLLS